MWWAITNSPGIFFMDSLQAVANELLPTRVRVPPCVEYKIITFIVARYSGIYIYIFISFDQAIMEQFSVLSRIFFAIDNSCVMCTSGFMAL